MHVTKATNKQGHSWSKLHHFYKSTATIILRQCHCMHQSQKNNCSAKNSVEQLYCTYFPATIALKHTHCKNCTPTIALHQLHCTMRCTFVAKTKAKKRRSAFTSQDVQSPFFLKNHDKIKKIVCYHCQYAKHGLQ